MNPNKASEPDGMIAWFYQKYWKVLSNDITKVILQFLNGQACLSFINHANIVLIPKVHSPSSAKHFRPITLCNVIYKIIAVDTVFCSGLKSKF